MPIIPQHQLTICNKNKTIQYIYGSCINIEGRYLIIPMFNNWLNEINPIRDRDSKQWIQEGSIVSCWGLPQADPFSCLQFNRPTSMCVVCPGPSEKSCQPAGFGRADCKSV